MTPISAHKKAIDIMMDSIAKSYRQEVLDEAEALAEYRKVWAEAEMEEFSFEELSKEPEGINIPEEWNH